MGLQAPVCPPTPPLCGIKQTVISNPTVTSVLPVEIEELLSKQTIDIVTPAEMIKGVYSHYLFVPKKSGGVRPTLDL